MSTPKIPKPDYGTDYENGHNAFGEFIDRDGFSRHCRATRRAGHVLEIIYIYGDSPRAAYISVNEFIPAEGCSIAQVPNFEFDELFPPP